MMRTSAFVVSIATTAFLLGANFALQGQLTQCRASAGGLFDFDLSDLTPEGCGYEGPLPAICRRRLGGPGTCSCEYVGDELLEGVPDGELTL